MSPEAQIYSCFDFRLRSEIPLPELALAEPGDARSIVDLRQASLPDALPGGEEADWHLQAADGEALLMVPAVGRFLMAHGERILVDPLPEATPRQLRLFLLGSALGILAHQRGLLPLHANAIVAGDGAFAFCGPSGAGKSTLAAHFEQAGYPLLSDDVCPLEIDAEGRALAWPGVPRLKLWPDAACALGHDPSTLERVTEDIEKYQLAHAGPGPARPVPLRRLYVLNRAQAGDDGRIVRLHGRDAMAAVLANTYRGFYLARMGLAARHFHQCVSMLRTVQVYAAPMAWGFDVFAREAARLERHMLEEDGA